MRSVKYLCASAGALLLLLALAGPASAAFGVNNFRAGVYSDAGFTQPESQAAAHPAYGLIQFTANSSNPNDGAGGLNSDPDGGRIADLEVNLPAGLEAMPDDFARCTNTQLNTPAASGRPNSCPAEAQVGQQIIFIRRTVAPNTTITIRALRPLYNMDLTADDQASRFAFQVTPGDTTTRGEIIGSIRDTGDFGQFFTTEVSSTVVRVQQVFWGTPGAAIHDADRGAYTTTALNGQPLAQPVPGGQTVTNTVQPFLTNPTTCAGPLTTTLDVTSINGDTDNAAYTTQDANGNPEGAQNCAAVPFDGTAAFAPTGPTRDAPYGFGVNLTVPQAQDSANLGQSHVKKITATLPPGVTINPAAGNTIQACTDAQFHAGAEAKSPIECPAASRVGTTSTVSPLTQGALTGSAYVGQPLPGDRYRLFLEFTGRGVSIRLKGSIGANPDTGQLTAVFDNQPQLPFDTLDLNLDGGPNGILASPNDCAAQQGNVAFGPWSGNPDVNRGQTVQATGCAAPLFSPGYASTAGSLKSGAYSTLVTTISRPDGQQFLRGVQVKLPKGALAQIKGQVQCSDAGANAGVCPAASRVGTAYTQSGAGSSPLPLNGSVYFTGPYKGAPYGLVTVVRAVAGPYDLGNVVVRQALNIDPRTTQVTVDSDALPQVVGGIPLRLRTLKLDINKGKFAINPTSCGAATSRGTFSSAQGTANTKLASVTLSGCKSLKFKPRLSLKLRGKGRFGDGDHPGLVAQLRGLGAHGTSGLKRAQVILPKSLALDPNNAQSLCEYKDSLLTDPKCPKGSVVGFAKARTPILAKTLSGKVYFAKRVRVSNGRQIKTLPQLVVALRGNGVKINLIGITSVSKDRLVTTFAAPDAPVSAFDLRVDGGKNGILVANTSVCGFSKRSRAAFRGYNGALVKTVPSLGVSCGSAKK